MRPTIFPCKALSKVFLPQVYNTRAFDYSKQEIFTQYPISFFSQI
jgi:hypothetical protein